jgi:hypothetical protein
MKERIGEQRNKQAKGGKPREEERPPFFTERVT